MDLTEVLDTKAIDNVLYHIKKCWDYTYPTGNALEEAFYRGIKPYYKDVKSLGSPKTIVDVSKGKTAFDIKGSKKLGHLKRLGKNSNFEENYFIEQTVPSKGKIKVRVSKSIHTQVRRPKVDLKGFKGNPEKILSNQINEYKDFVFKTATADGCTEVFSVVCQYGIDKGFKSVFLNITKFSIPEISNSIIKSKKDGTPAAYEGYDEFNNLMFALSSFNRGSSNLYKTFETTGGVLFTWPEEEEDVTVGTRTDLEKVGAVTYII